MGPHCTCQIIEFINEYKLNSLNFKNLHLHVLNILNTSMIIEDGIFLVGLKEEISMIQTLMKMKKSFFRRSEASCYNDISSLY